jgi:hypothetical protein
LTYNALLKENKLLKSFLVHAEKENLGLKIYHSERL